MACASSDSAAYSHHPTNIGSKCTKVTQFWEDYRTLEGLEQPTINGGALGYVLGFVDRGTPAGCRPELAWKLE